MEFRVTRTSLWGDKKPCEGVVFKKYDRIERREKTEEEYDRRARGWGSLPWRQEGSDHIIGDGYIQRTFKKGASGWFIKLNSLKALMEFIESVENEVVIYEDYMNPNIKVIEIYDDYRE